MQPLQALYNSVCRLVDSGEECFCADIITVDANLFYQLRDLLEHIDPDYYWDNDDED